VTAIPAPSSSRFHPAGATPGGDEPLAQTLQRLEGRPRVNGWGPFGSFLAAFFTIGLAPLIIWPARWSEVIEEERNDLVALAAWWRRRATPRDAQRMDAALERLNPWPLLLTVTSIVFWGMLVVFGVYIFNNGFDIDRIRDITYGWENHRRWAYYSLDALHLHRLWAGGLMTAYVCMWLVVRSHRNAVRSLVAAINRTAGPSESLRMLERNRSGLSPLWVIAAIIFIANSAWWGIPFALAGALQRRYTGASPMLRQALANQARFASMVAPSTSNHSGPVVPARFCATRGCAARLPADAKFCPRCGVSVAQTTVA
jgi:hypothetical protein